jgi:hypothetical protein
MREVHAANLGSLLNVSRYACGKVLIAGGVDEDGHPTSEADLVDPATGTLKNLSALVLSCH